MYQSIFKGGSCNDRYGRNIWAPVEITYGELLGRIKEVAMEYLPKKIFVETNKPQQSQSASSEKIQQDLTTGSSIDTDAVDVAKVVISREGAKHELNKLVHKYA